MIRTLRIEPCGRKALPFFRALRPRLPFNRLLYACCVLFFLLGACENREVNMSYSSIQEVHELAPAYHFHVIEVDQCHYLLLEVDRNVPHEGFGFFAHRGNCPNPIHQYDSTAWNGGAFIDNSPVLVGKPIAFDSLDDQRR